MVCVGGWVYVVEVGGKNTEWSVLESHPRHLPHPCEQDLIGRGNNTTVVILLFILLFFLRSVCLTFLFPPILPGRRKVGRGAISPPGNTLQTLVGAHTHTHIYSTHTLLFHHNRARVSALSAAEEEATFVWDN